MSAAVRSGLWLGFFAAVLAAWWVMFDMARMMGADLWGRPRGMAMMEMRSFGALFAMWAIMMAAMMGPTLVPTLAAYDDVIRRFGARAGAGLGGWLGVLTGYFAVWIGAAAVLAVLQARLMEAGLLNDLGGMPSAIASGALLVAAGAWQFTRAKEICHGVCHRPALYFTAAWRSGVSGGLRMGVGLGAFCAGCCWAIMGLGFAGGVMSLLWMGGATLFMTLEKLPQIGHRLMRPMGAALIAGGGAVIVGALT